MRKPSAHEHGPQPEPVAICRLKRVAADHKDGVVSSRYCTELSKRLRQIGPTLPVDSVAIVRPHVRQGYYRLEWRTGYPEG